MFTKLSERFAAKLVSAGIVSESNSDLYIYGCYQSLMLVLNVITSIVLGLVLNMFIPCILLNAAYIPIRLCAGGHHAESAIKCYVSSTIMIASLLLIIKWVPISIWADFLLLIVSSVIIIKLAPIESSSKPYDESEKRVCRKRSIFVLIIEVSISLVFLIIGYKEVTTIISIGLIAESIMMIVGLLGLKV